MNTTGIIGKIYTHPQFGTLRAMRLNDSTWFSLPDLHRMTGVTVAEIPPMFDQSYQLTIAGETFLHGALLPHMVRLRVRDLQQWLHSYVQVDLFADFLT